MDENNNIKDIEVEGEESLNPDNEFGSAYSIEKIDIDMSYFSIYELKRKYDRSKNIDKNFSQIQKKNQIILDSEFQREAVWKRKQQSELIESVLIGLPIPTMYFCEDRYANLIVVDGRQRLTAFFEFLDDKFVLSELKILKKLSGKKFSQLEPVYQSKIEDYQLIIQIIKPTTPDSIKFNIFDRVNRGGTPLNNQEMRNALYQGRSTDLLKKLSRNKKFKMATDNGIKENRMKDKYLILRAIAFYLWMNNMIVDRRGNLIKYNGDIDDFLGKTMEYLNFADLNILKNIEYNFILSMDIIYKILGNNAFRIQSENKKRLPINMNIFEVITYIMMQILKDNKINNLKSDNFIKDKYFNLIKNKEFLENIRNHRDSMKKVNDRFNIFARNFIEEIVND
ncbi:DUF262 domain-containing protein [Intestinibacter bartlettii]|uniref:DUF262 domain-containing protein n=1 Tax=Intestinibacter bartlettii TaxID=261299 RepID=UPI003521B51D